MHLTKGQTQVCYWTVKVLSPNSPGIAVKGGTIYYSHAGPGAIAPGHIFLTDGDKFFCS